MSPVRSDEAADRLREMVVEAGIDVEHLCPEDVERTWTVIRRFALERFDDVEAEPGDYDDGLLAQYGVYDWTFDGHNEFFELDMTRQLAVPAPGQPDLRQVCCTFKFTPTDELRALGEASLWSFELDLEEFFDRALALPGFAGVRTLGAAPVALEIAWNDE